MSGDESQEQDLGPEFSSHESSFRDVESILEEEHPPKQWVEKTKDSLVEDFIYSEVIKKVLPEVIESLEEAIGEVSDKEAIRAIKKGGEHGEGELYERILQTVVDAEDQEGEVIDNSIFGDKKEVSDAFGVDYVLRGGKRLRPAMTILTEYAVEGEVTGKSAMVGAAQEVVHASSLEHDDDMDGDTLRRGKLTSERVNRALYGEDGWKHTVLDGNRLEAWANESIISIIDDPSEEFNGIPRDAVRKFFQMEAKLNGGQKQDIEMEACNLREVDLSDYENMISGKTGALFESGVDIIVEDHLWEDEYSCETENKVRNLFDDYMTNFNRLFQAGDDALEVFTPQNIGKSVTDIVNRKITFPAIQTKENLLEEREEYGELFLDVFDGVYGEVTGDMRETAAEIGVDIPESEEMYEGWDDDWAKQVINEYGQEPAERKAQEYLEAATEAIDELYDIGMINEKGRDKYTQIAEFVWKRKH